MSIIKISGDLRAANMQVGSNNQQINNLQDTLLIDWDFLIDEIDAIIHRFDQKKIDQKEVYNLKKVIGSKDKGGIKKYIKENLESFVNNIICNLTAGGLIELIKIML